MVVSSSSEQQMQCSSRICKLGSKKISFFYKASKGKIPLVADKNRDLKRTRPQKIELKWTQNQLQVEYLKDLRAWIKGKISFFFSQRSCWRQMKILYRLGVTGDCLTSSIPWQRFSAVVKVVRRCSTNPWFFMCLFK